MKQLTKATKNYSKNTKVITAVENLLNQLNACEDSASHFRWTTRWTGRDRNLTAGQWGEISLIDFEDGSDYGVTIFEHDGDLFAVPGFAADGDWSARSVNGQWYTVVNEQPVVEA